VDVALDPFPYAGTTTTCEALWMGVPVVTVRGNSHAGRVGASLLTTTGLTEFIAESAGEAERIARDLLTDTARLDDLRETLRGKVAGSPLCDAGAFTSTLEDAFHAMWRAGRASG
jgi:predicted O-linked N-acetylglucosamine transferase (SPINDLY family)